MGFIAERLQNSLPFKDQPTKYEALQDSESDHSPSTRPALPAAQNRIKVSYFLAGLTAAFIVFILSASTISILKPSPKTAAEIEAEDWNHCGRSSKVAMERGCVMEPLFYGWMPPQCSWKEFSDRWPVFQDRAWYSDFNLTIPVPEEDLWVGKHPHIYTNKYVHFAMLKNHPTD